MAGVNMSRRVDCIRCGGPLTAPPSSGPHLCSYCGAVQPAPARPSRSEIRAAVHEVLAEDRNFNGVPDALERRPVPAPPRAVAPTSSGASTPTVLLVVLGTVLASALGIVVMIVTRAPAPPPRAVATAPRSTESSPTATLAATAEVPVPTATAAPTVPASAKPAVPAKKTTNEEWARAVVARRSAKLRECVEQDLARFPDAAKSYTVSVHIESDALPKNSRTTFSPRPSSGMSSCATLVIFYAFNEAGSPPPTPGPFDFMTSFAFPGATPAAKAQSGRGWD